MCTTNEYICLFRKYQRGKASVSEMNELLKGFEDDGKFCQWMDEVWQVSSKDMDPSLRDRLYVQIRERISVGQSPAKDRGQLCMHWSQLCKVAAVFLVFLAVGMCYWHFAIGSEEKWATISSRDKFLQFTLPDSSHVWLCRYSTLQYPAEFYRGNRNVRLSGEAYFEVRHDNEHPFIVEARRVRIRVTGTKFSVSDFHNERTSKVVLCEGSVNVSRLNAAQQREIHLHPNNAYVLLPNGHELVQRVEAAALVAWKDGQYRFTDTTLDAVLQRLGRFYGKNITCDASVGGRKVSCTIFLNDSFQVALQDLSHIVPISWHIDRNKCHIVGK